MAFLTQTNQSSVRRDNDRLNGEMRIFSHLKLFLLCEANCPHLFAVSDEDDDETTSNTLTHVLRHLDEGR